MIIFTNIRTLPLNDLLDIAASNKIYACVKTKFMNFESVFGFNIILAILSALRIMKGIGIIVGCIKFANSRAVSICAAANANWRNLLIAILDIIIILISSVNNKCK